jgi:hypothetical protein
MIGDIGEVRLASMDKWLLAGGEFLVITSLTILADRLLSTKVALVVLGIGIMIVLLIHREKFGEFQKWAAANKTTAVLFCTVAGAIIGFGCGLLVTQKAEAQKTMTAQQANNKAHDAKPTTKGSAKSPAPPSAESISVGNISQGPGSITQIGGTGNTAIIGGPAPRDMKREAQVNLIAALKTLVPAEGEPPTVAIRISETTKEPREYSGQIAYAFQEAGWRVRYYPGTRSMQNINGLALSSGVYCMGQRSNATVSSAVDALAKAGVGCQAIDMPARDDATIVTLKIMVGANE